MSKVRFSAFQIEYADESNNTESLALEMNNRPPPRKRKTRQSVIRWARHSAGGSKLSRVASGMMALILTVIGLALAISEALPQADILIENTEAFFIVMYVTSLLCISFVIVMGSCEKLSDKENVLKWRRKNRMDFLRAGAMVLGSGSIVYEALRLADYMETTVYCRNFVHFFNIVSSISFTLAQIYMLLVFSKIVVNRGGCVDKIARYAIAFIIATNLCIWYHTLIVETKEDIIANNRASNTVKNQPSPIMSALASTNYTLSTQNYDKGENFTDNSTIVCPEKKTYQKVFSSYLYPCTIEYSIVCVFILYGIWIRIGGESGSRLRRQSKIDYPTPPDRRKQCVLHPYFDNRCGLTGSLVVISVTSIVTIVYLYSSYREVNTDLSNILVFSLDLSLNIFILVVIPIVSFQMRHMKLKNDDMRKLRALRESRPFLPKKRHHRTLDKSVLIITFFGLLIFGTLTMIASGMLENWLVFCEMLVSVLSACTQTGFITYSVLEKRSTQIHHLEQRPGRQGLELMRGCNLALWALKTFAIRRNSAHSVQIRFFSFSAWSILSHIFMPLSILFRFHSVVCLSDIVSHSYTEKYVNA